MTDEEQLALLDRKVIETNLHFHKCATHQLSILTQWREMLSEANPIISDDAHGLWLQLNQAVDDLQRYPLPALSHLRTEFLAMAAQARTLF